MITINAYFFISCFFKYRSSDVALGVEKAKKEIEWACLEEEPATPQP